ncbi:MAG: cation transporting ATPase C-terminal domain-containing protein, partial [Deltaproteobacteria bacterium]|nr:cation transporting ATPase C-terminal domain-containing protein [Deltaproteobacteria bacterium]
IYVPPLARVFGFAPPGWKGWVLLLIFPAVMLVADEARKAVMRRKTVAPAPSTPSKKT